MNKKYFPTVVAFGYILFVMSAQPASALSIDVSKNGSVRIYRTTVLGDETERESEVEKPEQIKAREKKVEQPEFKKIEQRKKTELETSEREKSSSAPNEKRKSTENKEKEQRQPVKNLPENAKEKIRIKEDGGTVKLRLESERKSEKEVQKIEEMSDTHVEASFPAQLKLKDQDSQNTAPAIQERRERTGEKIELQAERNKSGEAEFKLVSRAVSAKSKGAEFVLDPATNQVIVTTPSGTQQVLTHLPDQAIENMKKQGVIGKDEVPELELTELSNGEVGYRVKHTRKKKLLGVFEREVPTEVLMSDQAGTLIENEIDQSWQAQILNWMSVD